MANSDDWTEELPTQPGLYFWRQPDVRGRDGGPCGGLVEVREVERCFGWPVGGDPYAPGVRFLNAFGACRPEVLANVTTLWKSA